MSHVPERTCIGCRVKRPKAELLRIVRTAGDAAGFDQLQRLPGRGAYVCRTEQCLRTGLDRGLNRALRITMPAAARHELQRAFTMGDR